MSEAKTAVQADNTVTSEPASDIGSLGLALDMSDAAWLRADVNWRLRYDQSARGAALANHIEQAVRESLALRDLVHHTRAALATMTAHRDALASALRALRLDANRLCDRCLGGTYEDDCRLAIKNTDAALREHADTGGEA